MRGVLDKKGSSFSIVGEDGKTYTCDPQPMFTFPQFVVFDIQGNKAINVLPSMYSTQQTWNAYWNKR